LTAEVSAVGANLRVRLIGVRGDCAGFGWADRPGERPEQPTIVSLGQTADGELWIDLAACPDVVTVTGPTAAGLRQARWWAEQVAAAGIPVAFVVDGPTSPMPPGGRAVPALADLLTSSDPAAGVEVVVCAAPKNNDRALRKLLSQARPRRVLVLVGEAARPGRWSIDVEPAPAPPGRSTGPQPHRPALDR
jgi:hypothetical protein